MAGRIRSIKPEILDDEVTANLPDLEYRIFIGTWLVADDHGNLRANADYLRGQILWARNNTTTEHVVAALRELVAQELLRPYEVRGQSYFHIEGWSKHQRVDKPGKPRVPPPPEDSRESRESPANPHETLAPDLRSPTSDLDHEVEGEPARAGARSSGTPTPLPVGWQPEPSIENANAASTATARGVVVDYALRRFDARMRADGVTARDWNAKWRGELVGEYPTPDKIREVIARETQTKTAQAARDRERRPLAQNQLTDADREFGRRAAKAAIDSNFQSPGLRLVSEDSDG